MLHDRALGAPRNDEHGRQRAPDDVAHRLHAVHEQAVARRLGHGDVETQIGIDEAVAPAVRPQRGVHLRDRGVHLAHVLVAMPLGGERGRLAVEDPPQLEEIVHPGTLVQRKEQTDRAAERVRDVRDGERAAVPRYHALRLEHAQGLANRGAADAEALRQLALRRKRVARPEAAAADLREQLLRNLLVDLATLERLVVRRFHHRVLV